MTGHPGLGAYLQPAIASATFLSISATPERRVTLVFDTVPSSLIWNLTIGDRLYDSFGRKLKGPLGNGFRFQTLGMHREGTFDA